MNKLDLIKYAMMSNNQSDTPAPPSNAFKTTWNMAFSTSLTLLTQLGDYNATIDWGDGTTPTNHTTGSPSHTYEFNGIYQISITGTYAGICMNINATHKDKLISIDNWGDVQFSSFENAYYGCSQLTSLPNGAITGVSNVISFASAFRGCVNLTEKIPDNFFDNCINVTTFSKCFYGLYGLQGLPNNLFVFCENVVDYTEMARGCRSMPLPETLFNLTYISNKNPIFTSAFKASAGYSHTGTVQPIWDYTTGLGTTCFQYCTLLENYDSIPSTWK